MVLKMLCSLFIKETRHFRVPNYLDILRNSKEQSWDTLEWLSTPRDELKRVLLVPKVIKLFLRLISIEYSKLSLSTPVAKHFF